MLEMNYIFAYGAAEPAMFLLKKFKLLDILLPLQVSSQAFLMRLNNTCFTYN